MLQWDVAQYERVGCQPLAGKLEDDKLIIQKGRGLAPFLPVNVGPSFKTKNVESSVEPLLEKPLSFGLASLKVASLSLMEETFTEAMFSTKVFKSGRTLLIDSYTITGPRDRVPDGMHIGDVLLEGRGAH
ncbi:hypothetical protein FOZ60_003079 [Perkinsus olseni]|uniref:Uncharacterized protein n=1 Tax=Perkinsus olseni TaxID=32597 RepID=A0A7J6PI86_PEROL|nr:hypothetical protein FOZ60_003079 [Perkinsus olseni]